MCFVPSRAGRAFDLPRARLVGWLGRSARVLGRVFRDASESKAAQGTARVLAFVGYLLTGVIEVLVPTHWWGLVLRRWVPCAALFGVTLVVLGTLLGKAEVSGFGWTVLLLLGGFVAVTLVLRGWLARRAGPLVRTVIAVVALALVALLTIGVIYAPDAWRVVLDGLSRLLGRG